MEENELNQETEKKETEKPVTIFVGRLTKNVWRVHLVTLCSKFGKVLKARIVPQWDNPLYNIGFVEMSEADAQRLLSQRLKLDGVKLSMTRALSKPSRKSARLERKRAKHHITVPYEPNPSCLK